MSCSGRAKADQAKGSASEDFRPVVDRTGRHLMGVWLSDYTAQPFPMEEELRKKLLIQDRQARLFPLFHGYKLGCDCPLILVRV